MERNCGHHLSVFCIFNLPNVSCVIVIAAQVYFLVIVLELPFLFILHILLLLLFILFVQVRIVAECVQP